MAGHEGDVNCAAIWEKILASGSDDKTVRLWDLVTGNPIRSLREHIASVTAVKFTTDGQFLISASKDRTVRVYETLSGRFLAALRAPSPLQAFAVAKDDLSIAAGGKDWSVTVWNMPSCNTLDRGGLPSKGAGQKNVPPTKWSLTIGQWLDFMDKCMATEKWQHLVRLKTQLTAAVQAKDSSHCQDLIAQCKEHGVILPMLQRQAEDLMKNAQPPKGDFVIPNTGDDGIINLYDVVDNFVKPWTEVHTRAPPPCHTCAHARCVCLYLYLCLCMRDCVHVGAVCTCVCLWLCRARAAVSLCSITASLRLPRRCCRTRGQAVSWRCTACSQGQSS